MVLKDDFLILKVLHLTEGPGSPGALSAALFNDRFTALMFARVRTLIRQPEFSFLILNKRNI